MTMTLRGSDRSPAMKAFWKEYDRFVNLQNELCKFGAADTEPDFERDEIIYKTLMGIDVRVPATGNEWQLYTVSMNCNAAASKLYKQMCRVVEAINKLNLADARLIREYLFGER